MNIRMLCLILLLPVVGNAQEIPAQHTWGTITVQFESIDSVDFPPLYADQPIRDSIGKSYTNWHDRATAIEQYLMQCQHPPITKIGETSYRVKTARGDSVLLEPNLNMDEAGYNFEHYYWPEELLVFRVQWYEGNDYALFNRLNGTLTHMIGPPQFSPYDPTLFVAINDDIEATYSDNGIQVFRIERGIPKLIWQYFPDDIAPSHIQWVASDALIFRAYMRGRIDQNFAYQYLHSRLKIKLGDR